MIDTNWTQEKAKNSNTLIFNMFGFNPVTSSSILIYFPLDFSTLALAS